MAMLPIETALHELEHFEGGSGPVLSLYLLTDPSTDPGRNLHAQLTDAMRALRANLAGEPGAGELIERLLPAVRHQIDMLGTPPRGLTLFVGAGGSLLRSVPLPVRVTPAAYWGDTPYLRPLLTALDEYERMVVVLLDKERVRFFRVLLDDIQEIADLVDLVPARQRQLGGARSHTGVDWIQGGWARGGLPRHEEMHVLWHAKRAAVALARLAGQERVDRVIVGGTPEVVAELRRLLPRPLRERIAGEIHVPLFARPAEVLATVQVITEAIERADEERLVNDLLEQLGRDRAVFGAADVLEAVREQRAYLIAFSASAFESGGTCKQCGLLMLAPVPGACPACGGPVRPVTDLIQLLAERVRDQGGRAEEVRGPAAERLSARGGIAALLRYVPVAGGAS